jgi:virginiamycin B lyase
MFVNLRSRARSPGLLGLPLERFVSREGIGQMSGRGAVVRTFASTDVDDLTVGQDGAIWFTEYNRGSIGRIGTDGSMKHFRLPHPGGSPSGITVGPDGAIWFAENSGNKIGRITTDGKVSEFSLYGTASQLVTGPDGALWFTDMEKIGRISTAGRVTQFAVPTSRSEATGITVGRDGAIWFTERDADRIGRVVPGWRVLE